jgi:hypothetical protein
MGYAFNFFKGKKRGQTLLGHDVEKKEANPLGLYGQLCGFVDLERVLVDLERDFREWCRIT